MPTWRMISKRCHIIRNMKYRRIVLAVCALLSFVQMTAQRKFDPDRFKAELHRFIKAEVRLNRQEAARLFPIYDEMMAKQRPVFDRLRSLHKAKPASDREAREMIKKADGLEIQLRQVEQRYHQEMLKVIPGRKLLEVLEAERKFHRQTFRRMAEEGRAKE